MILINFLSASLTFMGFKRVKSRYLESAVAPIIIIIIQYYSSDIYWGFYKCLTHTHIYVYIIYI